MNIIKTIPMLLVVALAGCVTLPTGKPRQVPVEMTTTYGFIPAGHHNDILYDFEGTLPIGIMGGHFDKADLVHIVIDGAKMGSMVYKYMSLKKLRKMYGDTVGSLLFLKAKGQCQFGGRMSMLMAYGRGQQWKPTQGSDGDPDYPNFTVSCSSFRTGQNLIDKLFRDYGYHFENSRISTSLQRKYPR